MLIKLFAIIFLDIYSLWSMLQEKIDFLDSYKKYVFNLY